MNHFYPKQRKQTEKNSEEKEISKGALGLVTKRSNETIFTFYKLNIDKRKKLKSEIDDLLKSLKSPPINDGIIKIKSINISNNSYIIKTEPIIDSLSNLYYMKFKGYQIFKIFQKFNNLIKYCVDNKINLSNLKLSDLYLTKNNELKLLSINYDLEILHKIKKEKFSINLNKNKNENNTFYVIGTILYYLYYNEYPKINETKFPEPKHLCELIKYCLNRNESKHFDFNEYFNHIFFNPGIIFPKCNKSKIIPFNLYKPIEKKDEIIPVFKDLFYNVKKEQISEYSCNYIYSIYDMNKNKIIEEKNSYRPEMYKLKYNQNNNLYVIIFDKKIYIIKKNSLNDFSIIQEMNLECINFFLELSNGDLAFIKGHHVYIYSKSSEDKFQEKLKLAEIKSNFIFETKEKYLCISGREKTILYDIKTNMKKIKEKTGKKLYINDKIYLDLDNTRGSSLYNEFFEEEIFNMDETILCAIKKKDGSYLFGGYKNNIYQFYFDEYGLAELVSKVDTGYGYYEDDLSGDCIYSIPDSRYYSVGTIIECENGDIITISDYCKRNKLWKL